MDTWIVDTSPFVGLAKVGLLALLSADGRKVIVPDVVEREVLAGSVEDAAKKALRQGWGVRMTTPWLPLALAALKLDAGEAAVLAVALDNPGSLAIMDDSAGRAAARELGIPVLGTVGVLLRAKESGHLAAVAPAVRALQSTGLFLPKTELLQTLLVAIGEAWP